MAIPVFRFGRFRLDPQARELFEDGERVNLPLSTTDCLIYLIRHRDRPIGRDELASAVWGRVDVSEVSLNHSVMRLRRLLGDTGNEQRVIRTVPRLGYRWIMDVAVETAAVDDAAPPPAPIADIDGSAASSSAAGRGSADPVADRDPQAGIARTRRRSIAVVALLAFAVMLGVATFVFLRSPAQGGAEAKAATIAVLPAGVDAAAEWSWLRFGLMDLVASQLQRAGIGTVPSETIVAMSNATDAATVGDAFAPGGAVVTSMIRHIDGQWLLRIEMRGENPALIVEARDTDPIRAARAAADELVIKLGHTPPADAADDATLARETLKRRVNAAVFAGQLDIARQLIDTAAPALRANPEIALSQATIGFFSGDYDAARRQVEGLLGTLPASAPPELRARALNTLGATYFRQGRIDDAERSYGESIRLLEDADEPGLLARAYIGIGGVASQRMQLEAAAASYGRARTLHEMRNDAFGVAAVDLNLGMNALQRGQPAAALTILHGVGERFERLRAEDALAATWAAEVDAEIQMLDIDAAIATAERMRALETRAGNRRQRWELTFARAQVLVASGRLQDADTLLARILDSSDASEDAAVRLLAGGLLARIALLRGHADLAVELAAPALIPALQTRSRFEYAQAWLTLIRALQRSGRTEAAAQQATRMRAWSDADPNEADIVYAILAQADQAAFEDRADLAVSLYADAMKRAAKRALPEEMVAVGEPYVRQLLASGRLEEAVSVNGRIAAFADRDPRAASAAAQVYAAMGDPTAAGAALARARRLAGERVLANAAIVSQ